jgi:hypothetical protein
MTTGFRGGPLWRGVLLGALLAAAMTSEAGARPKKANAPMTYPPEVEEHCTDDYFTHCSTYELGSLALKRCMEAKSRQLSPNCRQALRDAGLGGSRRR